MVQGKYFLIVPTVPKKCWGYNIGTSAPLRFFVVYGRAKSRVVTISLSPQGGAYIRALKSEGSLSPPIPVGGGAVDTNDSCISEEHVISAPVMLSNCTFHIAALRLMYISKP